MADSKGGNPLGGSSASSYQATRQSHCCELAPPIELVLDDPREEHLFAADGTTPDAGNRVGR